MKKYIIIAVVVICMLLLLSAVLSAYISDYTEIFGFGWSDIVGYSVDVEEIEWQVTDTDILANEKYSWAVVDNIAYLPGGYSLFRENVGDYRIYLTLSSYEAPDAYISEVVAKSSGEELFRLSDIHLELTYNTNLNYVFYELAILNKDEHALKNGTEIELTVYAGEERVPIVYHLKFRAQKLYQIPWPT